MSSKTILHSSLLSSIKYLDQIWKQDGLTLIGENDRPSRPCGLFIDDNNQSIYIAECENDRIIQWKFNNGTKFQIVAGGNGRGSQINQLRFPTDVIIDHEKNILIIADRGNRRVIEWSLESSITQGQILHFDIKCWGLTMDKYGCLYVSDTEKQEVRRWKRGENSGIVVAGGNGQGDQLNQLNFPTYLFIDDEDSLYVSDSWNHRVMKWIKDAKEGIIVAGGNGQGNSLSQLNRPTGVIVDRFDQIYVNDNLNYRVMKWMKEGKEGIIVAGGNGQGKGSNQFHYPEDLSFDREGNLYVSDCFNHRIQKFEIA